MSMETHGHAWNFVNVHDVHGRPNIVHFMFTIFHEIVVNIPWNLCSQIVFLIDYRNYNLNFIDYLMNP